MLLSFGALLNRAYVRPWQFAAGLFFLFSAVALVIGLVDSALMAMRHRTFPPRTLRWALTLAAVFALLADASILGGDRSLDSLIIVSIVVGPVVLQAWLLWKMPAETPREPAAAQAFSGQDV